jgi:acyl-CoA hydrolase
MKTLLKILKLAHDEFSQNLNERYDKEQKDQVSNAYKHKTKNLRNAKNHLLTVIIQLEAFLSK